jgi:hypothetical protein
LKKGKLVFDPRQEKTKRVVFVLGKIETDSEHVVFLGTIATAFQFEPYASQRVFLGFVYRDVFYNIAVEGKRRL